MDKFELKAELAEIANRDDSLDAVLTVLVDVAHEKAEYLTEHQGTANSRDVQRWNRLARALEAARRIT